jgi:hypothetical protein
MKEHKVTIKSIQHSILTTLASRTTVTLFPGTNTGPLKMRIVREVISFHPLWQPNSAPIIKKSTKTPVLT